MKETAVPAPNEPKQSLMSKVPPVRVSLMSSPSRAGSTSHRGVLIVLQKKPVANTTATQLPSKLQQPVTAEVFSVSNIIFCAAIEVTAILNLY